MKAEQAAAEKAAAERAATAMVAAAALGLLQPLEALALDADSLRTAIAAAVAYCDAQGAEHLADLVKRARMLIANPSNPHAEAYRLGLVLCGALRLPNMTLYSPTCIGTWSLVAGPWWVPGPDRRHLDWVLTT